jgi:hypothetical protein
MLIDFYSQNPILSMNTLCQIHDRLLGELFKTLEMNTVQLQINSHPLQNRKPVNKQAGILCEACNTKQTYVDEHEINENFMSWFSVEMIDFKPTLLLHTEESFLCRG